MKFEANRTELYEMAAKAAKIAKNSQPIEALRGILIEADEERSEITLIATDYQSSILMSAAAKITESGSSVINASFLTKLIELLPEETVSFCLNSNSTLKISSGKSVYNILVLRGNDYPCPVMPFPEEAVKMTGICTLAKKTLFATSKNEDETTLRCVSVKFTQNTVNASACDKNHMVMIRGEADCSDKLDTLLPAESLKVLASISTDEDEYEVGSANRCVVFTKKNLMFSMRQMDGEFMDTAMLVKMIKPKFSAIVRARDMEEVLSAMDMTKNLPIL